MNKHELAVAAVKDTYDFEQKLIKYCRATISCSGGATVHRVAAGDYCMTGYQVETVLDKAGIPCYYQGGGIVRYSISALKLYWTVSKL